MPRVENRKPRPRSGRRLYKFGSLEQTLNDSADWHTATAQELVANYEANLTMINRYLEDQLGQESSAREADIYKLRDSLGQQLQVDMCELRELMKRCREAKQGHGP